MWRGCTARSPPRSASNAQAIRKHVTQSLDEAKAGTVSPGVLDQALSHMARLFDVRYGGFGTAPKFPHPGPCDAADGALARHAGRVAPGNRREDAGRNGPGRRARPAGRRVSPLLGGRTLDRAALREDVLRQLGAAQGLPHARRRRSAMRAGATWRRASWIGCSRCWPTASAGAFFTSQDADVGPGDDGDYWTWTVEEARAALSESEFELARRTFDIEPEGEMHHNPAKNVLWRAREPASDARARAARGPPCAT